MTLSEPFPMALTSGGVTGLQESAGSRVIDFQGVSRLPYGEEGHSTTTSSMTSIPTQHRAIPVAASVMLMAGLPLQQLAARVGTVSTFSVQDIGSLRVSNPWTSACQAIEEFAALPDDWDGYGTGPIGQPAIAAALGIIRAAEDSGTWKFAWANPTSEDGILMQLAHTSGVTMKLEVGEEGDIGAMVKPPGAEPEFFDIAVHELEEFFAQQSNDPTV